MSRFRAASQSVHLMRLLEGVHVFRAMSFLSGYKLKAYAQFSALKVPQMHDMAVGLPF